MCIYHSSAWSNFDLFHNSQWIVFRTQSCLVLFLFSSLSHLLIIWFWFVHIPFVSMAKFQSLAHFSEDCLSHPIKSTLIPFYCFISVTTQLTLANLLQVFNFCFNITNSYGNNSSCYLLSFSFSLQVPSAEPFPGHLNCNFL